MAQSCNDRWYTDCWTGCDCINETEQCKDGYHRIGHEGCTAELKKCPNYEVCGQKHPYTLMACTSGMCRNCDAQLRVALTFVDELFNCSLCLDDCGRGIVFPGGCNHVICVACFRLMMAASFPDPREACRPVNPVLFGAPPCPCATSCESRPCVVATGNEEADVAHYERDKDALHAWMQRFPLRYRLWTDIEEASVIDSPAFACPMCRRVPSQNSARTWSCSNDIE